MAVPSVRDLSLCIFCLRADGGFRSEEHVLPEGLGNYKMVLRRGVVCDRCNSGVLAYCDQSLVKFPPLAFMKTTARVRGKNRKLPRMDRGSTRIYALETTAGNDLYLAGMTGSSEPRDGKWQQEMELQWSELHSARCGRALLKAGLEKQAFENGKAAALLPQWDGVRRAVLDGLPGLLIVRKTTKPTAEFGLTAYPIDYRALPRLGLAVMLDYFGVHVGAVWPPDPVEAGGLPGAVGDTYAFMPYAREPNKEQFQAKLDFSFRYESVTTGSGSPDVRKAVEEIEAYRRARADPLARIDTEPGA